MGNKIQNQSRLALRREVPNHKEEHEVVDEGEGDADGEGPYGDLDGEDLYGDLDEGGNNWMGYTGLGAYGKSDGQNTSSDALDDEEYQQHN